MPNNSDIEANSDEIDPNCHDIVPNSNEIVLNSNEVLPNSHEILPNSNKALQALCDVVERSSRAFVSYENDVTRCFRYAFCRFSLFMMFDLMGKVC